MEKSDLDKIESEYDRTEIIKTLKSDEEKIKFIDGLKREWNKVQIIKTFRSDDRKIEFLDKMENETSIVNIIKSLQDDNKKLQNLYRVQDEIQKASIIEEFTDDDKKIKGLEQIKLDLARRHIIKTFKSDDKKISLLDKQKSDSYNAYIIKTIKDDNKKIECLEMISNEDYKIDVIKTLKSDELKIKLLPKISSWDNKVSIIITFQDDSKKIEQLENIEKEEYKVKIIQSLKSDEFKLKLLETIQSEKNRLKIIQSFQDDNVKMKKINKITDEKEKIKIIQGLQSDDNKIFMLQYIKEEINRVIIIKGIQDDNIKLELLDDIKSELNKIQIIISMQDENKRLKAIGSLSNEENIIFVVSKFKNEAIKLRAIKKINEKIYESYKELLIFNKEMRLGKNRKTRHKYKMLGLPKNMTIGMEIEAEGEYGELLPERIGYWNVKQETSLDSGKECTSPIMYDTDTYIYQIYKINEILSNMEMKITPKCAGHVHIGADYIKTEEGFKELLELWGNSEEIYYLISNKQGELPREGIKEYATPISVVFEKDDFTEEKKDCFIEDAKEKQVDRYKSLNLLNVNNGKNTIEFRLSNGTLDGNTWIENIRLYGRTVQIAQELGQIKEKIDKGIPINEEEKRKYALKEMLKDERPIDEKMEILMEILFTEEESQVYRKRYELNKRIEEKEHSMEVLEFGKVDFQEVYESVEIPQGIVDEIQEEREEIGQR